MFRNVKVRGGNGLRKDIQKEGMSCNFRHIVLQTHSLSFAMILF